MQCRLSLVLPLFCFVSFLSFVFLISLKPRPFVQSFFDMHAPRQSHAVTNCLRTFCFYLFLFFFFSSLETSLFPSIFVPLPFSLCMESTSYLSPFRMVFFYLVTTGRVFDINLLCENSIKLINQEKLPPFSPFRYYLTVQYSTAKFLYRVVCCLISCVCLTRSL